MPELIKNRLGYSNELFILQDKKMFNYSVDTVLLGNFLTLSSQTRRVLDVGTNNGALAIFVAQRKLDLLIDAIEINARAAELAEQNVALNALESRVRVIGADFNAFAQHHAASQHAKYDAIICNPPFYKLNTGLARRGDVYAATHEISLSLEGLLHGASKIIKQKGHLALVEPIERLVDVFVAMRHNHFEPKRVQIIYPRVGAKANLVLVEGRYQSGWGTSFLPSLYLHPQNPRDHKYLPAVIALYKPLPYVKGRAKNG